ncbi:exodeoxyribonuclease VII small subunit [Nodularia spumigena]|uniref:exodeoxyribonuclease VII small subunit n=1 Tax=Nodularia spumigena TaxID=70799 RepID=UPI002B1ED94F|nr:exodeoxyribonuclease VII small subunit [Nodularia spumigena]MEA5614840.1 exodeoxyribonuclease VII small subunit [Nodularia spumigena UHCC 0040]
MTDRPAKPKPADPVPNPEERYEVLVEQLEDLVERIESGEIGLEDSIKAYEQGIVLITKARSILLRAEQRIEQLDLETLRKRAAADESS